MAKMSRTRQELIEEFKKSLSENVVPWRKPWMITGRKPFENKSYSSGKNYRGINQMWLEYVAKTRGYKSTEWLTFNQIRTSKLHFVTDDEGQSLAKGQGVPIEVYKPWDNKNKKEINFDEFNKIMNGDDEEAKKDVFLLVKNYTVFNGDLIQEIKEATEKKLDEEAKLLRHETPSEVERYVDDVLDTYALNEKILINESLDENRAYYTPLTDFVHLPDRGKFSSESAFLATKAHELSHSTGHPKRLDRDLINVFSEASYAKEELRAEIGSTMLTADLGLPVEQELTDNHKAYVKDWLSVLDHNPEELFRAINDADKIVDYIKDHGNARELLLRHKCDYYKGFDLTKENLLFKMETAEGDRYLSLHYKDGVTTYFIYDENGKEIISDALKDSNLSNDLYELIKDQEVSDLNEVLSDYILGDLSFKKANAINPVEELRSFMTDEINWIIDDHTKDIDLIIKDKLKPYDLSDKLVSAFPKALITNNYKSYFDLSNEFGINEGLATNNMSVGDLHEAHIKALQNRIELSKGKLNDDEYNLFNSNCKKLVDICEDKSLNHYLCNLTTNSVSKYNWEKDLQRVKTGDADLLINYAKSMGYQTDKHYIDARKYVIAQNAFDEFEAIRNHAGFMNESLDVNAIMYSREHGKSHIIFTAEGNDDFVFDYDTLNDTYTYIPSWDVGIYDQELHYLENDYEIVYMTDETHAKIWQYISEDEEIEQHRGVERYKDYCIANDINQAAIISTTGEAVGNILTDRDIPLNAKSILDCTDDADVKKHDQEITSAFEKLGTSSNEMVDVTTINGTEVKKTRCTLNEALNIIPDKFDYKNGCDIMLNADKGFKLKLYDNNCNASIINIKSNKLRFQDIVLNDKKREYSLNR